MARALGQELLQSGAGNLLQSGSIVIAKWARYYYVGQLYYKVELLLQKKLVHLRDTRTNGDPCLLTEPMRGISDGSSSFRKIHIFIDRRER